MELLVKGIISFDDNSLPSIIKEISILGSSKAARTFLRFFSLLKYSDNDLTLYSLRKIVIFVPLLIEVSSVI